MSSIKMPKEIGEKWLAALRSGEYTQGSSLLKTAEGNYCCLGVLQMVVDGQVEEDPEVPGTSAAIPSMGWCVSKGIDLGPCCNPMVEFDRPPAEDPDDSGCTITVAEANDGDFTFLEIADAIEKEMILT